MNAADTMPTESLIKTLEKRYPMGLIIGYVTEDPSEVSSKDEKYSEVFVMQGPISTRRGMLINMMDNLRDRLMFDEDFIDTDDDDDEDF